MDLSEHIKRAKRLTILLDTKFSFLGLRFGLDPLLDFLPGIGSVIGAVTSFYIFWIAVQLKVPTDIYVKMLINIGVDLFFGSIPVLGVILDVFYKSNVKNIKLLEPFMKKGIIDAEVVE